MGLVRPTAGNVGGEKKKKIDLRCMELEASVWKTFYEIRKVKLYAENLFLIKFIKRVKFSAFRNVLS